MKSNSTVSKGISSNGGFNFSILARNASKFYNTKIIGIDNISPQISPLKGMQISLILDIQKTGGVRGSISKLKRSTSRGSSVSPNKTVKKSKDGTGWLALSSVDNDKKSNVTDKLPKQVSADTQDTNVDRHDIDSKINKALGYLKHSKKSVNSLESMTLASKNNSDNLRSLKMDFSENNEFKESKINEDDQ